MDAHILDHGFAVIDGFLTAELVSSIRDEIDFLLSQQQLNEICKIVYSNDGFLVRASHLEIVSDFLFDLAREKKILSRCQSLLGRPVVPLHTEFFSKQPGCNFRVPAHQEHAFYDHFPNELAITLWCSLDEITEDNGALEFAGIRHNRLLPHRLTSNVEFGLELCDSSALTFTKVPVSAGSCIAFDSFVVHRSGVNISSMPRRAIALKYRVSPYNEIKN